MHLAFTAIIQLFLFVSLYIQVFLIITLIEHREALRKRAASPAGGFAAADLPSVSVIVPCYNEQSTVIGTIESLKRLEYPADKLSIIAVDDGSTDDTWSYLERYAADPRVTLYRKANGGKHTAVNLGIERSMSDIVGCLDADSFVHPAALMRMVEHFADPAVSAVTPAIKIRTPRGILEYIQYAEYNIGIFLRKMYSTINAIHVTPGPLSLFRRSVFAEIGPFRSAYNTEDLEMALRMHRNNLRIENAEHAYVYTTPPATVRALVKQRVRWTTGFLLNLRDYRDLLFSRRHGHIGMFTLPAGIISLVCVMFFAVASVVNAATTTIDRVGVYRLVGWSWHWPTAQLFFIDTTIVRLLTLTLIASAILFIFLGKRMTSGSWGVSRDMLCYATLYGFLAPVWIAAAWYRALTRNVGSWR